MRRRTLSSLVSGIVRLAALAVGLSFATLAGAQSYPERPIRLLVPFPPGGGANVVARLVAQSMSASLGQPVVVENRPGSNGNLAGDVLARAAPDGYTLMIASGSLFSVNPHLYAKMSFVPFVDVVPVATLTSDELLLTENAELAPKSFPEFIEYARQAKPPLLFGSIGNGSEHHLAMELLKEEAGVPMTHVPYRGGAAAAIGVAGGEVAAMFGGGSVMSLMQAGKLRALAISGRKRSRLFPDLPPISQFYPAYDVTILQVLSAPAGTPQPILARLRAEIKAAVSLPEFEQKIVAAGSGEPFITTAEEMTARLHADDERFGKVIESAGLRVE
jgi:tripartite-type tricarboxylate transporter receptor subunit TctC